MENKRMEDIIRQLIPLITRSEFEEETAQDILAYFTNIRLDELESIGIKLAGKEKITW